jgi:LysR family transcriptional regulator, glycine cleavage system transcriptional activator
MVKRTPPLHVLSAFEAVARLSSFSKAADELGVTRSAVSHRIQMLEDLLGTPAFDRGQRSFALTPTGAAYLVAIRRALTALRDVAALTGNNPRTKRVAVTMPPTFARMVVMPRLRAFLEQNPNIEVSIELSMSQLDYKAGDTDLDIRFGTGQHFGLESRLVLSEPIFPVTSPGYAQENRLQEPKDLVRAQLLRSRLEPWRPWFDAAGLDWEEPDVGHRFEDLSLLYHAAAHGLGVALVRASLARPMLDGGAIVPLFGMVANSPHAYYLVYERSVLDRPEVAALIEWLAKGDC